MAEDETLSITDSMDINFFFKEDFQVFCLFFVNLFILIGG